MTRVPIPLVVDADFFESGHAEPVPSTHVGSHTWYTWLGNGQHRSFAFRGQQRVFTARREPQRHGWYWYAYRKHHGKTYKIYLGKSEELTLARLYEAAALLASRIGSTALATPVPALPVPSPVTTTYEVPSLPVVSVIRPRLVARLEAGRKGKLVVLSAPAGWGKTALLGAWCAHIAAQHVAYAWMTLDAVTAEPPTFWTTFINALQSVQPGIGSASLTLLRNTSTSLDNVLKTLVHELHSLQQETVLVLDDCQHFPAAYRTALTFLLDHMPTRLHLVLAGRTDPPLSLARLRIQGQLLELRASDLALSTSEACTLLAEVLHLPVSRDICDLLVERTEGWSAAIHLVAFAAHHALEGQGEPNLPHMPDLLAHCGGGNRYLQEYVVEEILSHLPQATQCFLVQTSILQQLNGVLCDSVMGGSESQAQLDELVRLNLCVPLPGEGQPQYRYATLLGEALRAHLQHTYPARVSELHRRASQWYEQQGMLAEALHYARASGDETVIARLLKNKTEKEISVTHVEPVTERERDVLSLLIEGASNREIAQRLVISEGTVKKHVSNICSKLGVRRRAQAITRALAWL